MNLFGERTYLELFPRGVQGGVGFSGLALSVEQPGAIDSVVAWLDAKFDVAIRRRLVEGLWQGKSYPWSHSVAVDHDRGDSLWQVHSWVIPTKGWPCSLEGVSPIIPVYPVTYLPGLYHGFA